tara:strand:+ start:458 stop:934 length:477 start_codon:yes stop_codon:yes gene_type:complete
MLGQMEFHIFILSTMSLEMTQANLKIYGIPFELVAGSIQKVKWPENTTLWIACQHPVSQHLSQSLLPFMDANVVWYHDNAALSCVKVREAVSSLEEIVDNIWLMATVVPVVRVVHESRIELCYDMNGFVRPYTCGTLKNSIEKILKSELMVQKSLYLF